MNADEPDRHAGLDDTVEGPGETPPPAAGEPPGPVTAMALTPPQATGAISEPEPVPAAPRHRGRRWLFVVLAVVGVAVVAAGGLIAYRENARSSSARTELAGAIEALERADDRVVTVDAVIQAPLSASLEQSAAAAAPAIPSATEDLEEALRLLRSARPGLPERETTLADALADAAEGRLEMMEAAAVLLPVNESAAAALGHAEEGWDLLLKSERAADRAVVTFNEHTAAGVKESLKLTDQARSDATRAAELFSQASTDMPSADLGRYVEYAQAKAALLASSRRIDELWLAGKVAESNALLPAYNAEEKKVIAMAEALGGAPASRIGRAFDEATRAETQRYATARRRATDADERVRRAQAQE